MKWLFHQFHLILLNCMYLIVWWTFLANSFKQFFITLKFHKLDNMYILTCIIKAFFIIWKYSLMYLVDKYWCENFHVFAILSSIIDWWIESLSDRKKKNVQCMQRDKKGALHAQEEFPWGIPGSVDDHCFPCLAEHLRVTRRVFTICRFQSPVSNLLHLYLQSRSFFFLIWESLSVLSGFLSNTGVQVVCLSLPSSWDDRCATGTPHTQC